jgi:DNA-binding transcriptional ArsR family regulator
MDKKKLGKSNSKTKKASREETVRHRRPSWIPEFVSEEEDLCPECFRAVGSQSRYKLICTLGKRESGMTVTALTQILALAQPTVTHHLQVLRSVDAVKSTEMGRERIYQLNRKAHCFEECKIPF